MTSKQCVQMDTAGFDIGTCLSRRNPVGSQRARMRVQLLAFDERDLPLALAEVALVFDDAFPRFQLQRIRRDHQLPAFRGMNVQRNDAADVTHIKPIAELCFGRQFSM